MQLVREWTTDSDGPQVRRSVEVVIGLLGGGQIHGRLGLPGAWGVHDLLNNVREPMITLDGVGRASASLTVSRAHTVWVCPVRDEAPLQAECGGGQIDHPVVIHAGPFELHGTITTYRQIDWANYLVGRAGPPAEFLVLNNAHVQGSAELPGGRLVVNVALVAAIFGQD